MKKYIISILIVASAIAIRAGGVIPAKIVVPCDSVLAKVSLDTAIRQNGVREATNRNDGVQVEKYLASVGLPKGNPYCAAGQYYSFGQAAKSLSMPTSSIPIAKTGSTVAMYNEAQLEGTLSKNKQPEVGDLVFWRRGRTNTGHVERIVAVGKAGWVTTIAFNTSASATESQREGDGVSFKKRCLSHPLTRMQLRGLVSFKDYERGNN